MTLESGGGRLFKRFCTLKNAHSPPSPDRRSGYVARWNKTVNCVVTAVWRSARPAGIALGLHDVTYTERGVIGRDHFRDSTCRYDLTDPHSCAVRLKFVQLTQETGIR